MDESFSAELIAFIRVVLDEQAKAAAVEGVKHVETALERAAKQAAETERQMSKLRDTGEKLRTVGANIAGLGAAGAAPLALAMRSYLQDAQALDPVNRRWLEANRDIERSSDRIGRRVTESILPAIEAGADLMRQIAALADQHPELVSAAVLGSGAAIAIGTTLAGVGQAVTGAAAVGTLLARLGVGGAAAGAGAGEAAAVGTALGIAAGPIIAVAVGAAIALALTPGMAADAQRFYGPGSALSQMSNDPALLRSILSGGPLPYGNVGQSPLIGPQGAQWSASPGAPGNVGYAPSMGPQIAPELTAAANQYRAAEIAADKAYLAQRVTINKTAADRLVQIDAQAALQRAEATRAFGTAAVRAEQDHQRQRLQQVQDFVRTEAATLAAYYQQRQAMADAYGVQAGRMEEDFQRQQLRRQEDLEATVKDLADRRDGLGILRAQRQAELERRRAEEDHATAAGRMSEDFAAQLRDGERQLREQQQQRQEAFDRQQAQEQADYDLSRKRAGEDFAQQLADIDANAARQRQAVEADRVAALTKLGEDLDAERTKRAEQFVAQLEALDTFGNDELAKRAMFYALMGKQFVDWANSIGYPLPDAASAAYSAWNAGEHGLPPGRGNLPGGDFADGGMAQTTRGRGRIVVQQQFTFNGRLAQDEKDEYRRIANEETRTVLNEVMG